jgi:hypothetical protein
MPVNELACLQAHHIRKCKFFVKAVLGGRQQLRDFRERLPPQLRVLDFDSKECLRHLIAGTAKKVSGLVCHVALHIVVHDTTPPTTNSSESAILAAAKAERPIWAGHPEVSSRNTW